MNYSSDFGPCMVCQHLRLAPFPSTHRNRLDGHSLVDFERVERVAAGTYLISAVEHTVSVVVEVDSSFAAVGSGVMVVCLAPAPGPTAGKHLHLEGNVDAVERFESTAEEVKYEYSLVVVGSDKHPAGLDHLAVVERKGQYMHAAYLKSIDVFKRVCETAMSLLDLVDL